MLLRKSFIKSMVFSFVGVFFSGAAYAETIEYQLSMSSKIVNFSERTVAAISINNSIPGPTIRGTVGDILRIEVTNNLDAETSIHWHGVLVPNRMDGVPYITTPPIEPGKSFIYEFPIRHSGTYWYHAHSALQEQQGAYGPIVLYPKNDVKNYDEEHVVVLSDWTNEDPKDVLANLKRDPEYYALKKDSVQSWYRVFSNGQTAINLRMKNAMARMSPMDLSDVGYDAFLINGEKSLLLTQAQAGTRIKLRIINAAASSAFLFEYSGGSMEVLESDGVQVEPFTTKQIRIAMAETYDVIVTVPESKTYEFRASSEDGTGYAVAYIGQGDLIPASTYPRPNLVLMSMDMTGSGAMENMHTMSPMNHSENREGMVNRDPSSTHTMSIDDNEDPLETKMKDHPKKSESNTMDMADMSDSSHEGMSMSHGINAHSSRESHLSVIRTAMSDMTHPSLHNMNSNTTSASPLGLRHIELLNNYKEIKSPTPTTLPKENPSRTVTLRLTGSMERYVWTINEIPMYAADKIDIRKGENVRLIFVNETMMNHPMHLHGHFFRVLNGQGDYSPLKHTVNVAPFETVEIEFEANEEKDWPLHCHNLYHMKLGMGRIVHYEGTEIDADLVAHHKDHSSEHGNQWFAFTQLSGFSNFANLNTKIMRNNENIIFDARSNYDTDYEVDLLYERYISQFLGLYFGGNFKNENDEVSNRGVIGLEYVLPLFIKLDLRVNTEAGFRLGLSNTHQLTDRVALGWKWNTEEGYTVGLSYNLTKQFHISANYDSREKLGLGLIINC